MSTLVASLAESARRPDPALAAILTVLALLALAAPVQLTTSLGFLGHRLLEVAPYLLVSVVLAASAKASGADGLIGRAFKGRTTPMIIAAAFIGALAPLCSCCVIPLIAALLAMGVPLPAVMAFWLASPIMAPPMFVMTFATLGLGFALFKTMAAVAIGLIGGFGVAALLRAGALEQPLRPGIGGGCCSASAIARGRDVAWRFWQEPERRDAFAREVRETTLFLGKWLVFAFLLESLMLAYVPGELIASVLGEGGWGPVILAALVGAPAYLNGYAALPLIGGLLEQGMAPGAAMAFLLAGGVTSIPAAVAVYALARPPLFATYLAFALLGSLALGVAYGLVV